MSAGVGGGGGDDPKPKPMTPLSHEQITLWSDFADQNPNLKTMDDLFGAFSAKYPKSGIDRDNLRMNLDSLMAKMQEREKAWGGDLADSVTPGLSFPMMYYGDKPWGRMNAFGQTKVPVPQPNTYYPEKLIQKEIPNDVTDIWWDEDKALWAYEDPREGVIKWAQKSAGNTPQMKELAKRNAEQKQQQ